MEIPNTFHEHELIATVFGMFNFRTMQIQVFIN